MNGMIRIVTAFFLLSPSFCFAQNSTLTDGPYLFYKGDHLFIESVVNGKWKKDSVVLEREVPPLSIAVTGQGTVFSVPLKKELSAEAVDYKPAERLFVTSDIEGTFQSFTKMLAAGGVIDGQYKWTFGKGHLVVCGDVFDRGDEVTACFWLLYKLEDEARSAGGRVHLLMGNHEIMNLSEDLRYVNSKYIEVASLMQKRYEELYAANTELGRWLRTKNIMERIGDWLFLHGGVSQAVNETGLSLKEINRRARPLYDSEGFDSLINAAKAGPFFNEVASPFWYRGYFLPPLASAAQIDSTLRLFRVKHIVVGHTIVDSIKPLYNGKVIAIDVNHHSNNHQALLIEKDSFYRMNLAGGKIKLN